MVGLLSHFLFLSLSQGSQFVDCLVQYCSQCTKPILSSDVNPSEEQPRDNGITDDFLLEDLVEVVFILV